MSLHSSSAEPGRLSAHEVLSLWECGEDGDALDHTLAILTGPLALVDDTAETLPIGERDRRILGVHEQLFGPMLHAASRCPRCAEQLTFDIATPPMHVLGSGVDVLRSGNLIIRFRLPDSADMRAASRCADVLSARNLLLERCVLSVTRDGETVEAVDALALTDDVVQQLAAQMTACDPRAEILLDMRCPACDHAWEAVLDIGQFFWAELTDLARRLLREVHVLARAFHWSEADILRLSSRRRQWYLELAEA